MTTINQKLLLQTHFQLLEPIKSSDLKNKALYQNHPEYSPDKSKIQDCVEENEALTNQQNVTIEYGISYCDTNTNLPSMSTFERNQASSKQINIYGFKCKDDRSRQKHVLNQSYSEDNSYAQQYDQNTGFTEKTPTFLNTVRGNDIVSVSQNQNIEYQTEEGNKYLNTSLISDSEKDEHNTMGSQFVNSRLICGYASKSSHSAGRQRRSRILRKLQRGCLLEKQNSNHYYLQQDTATDNDVIIGSIKQKSLNKAFSIDKSNISIDMDYKVNDVDDSQEYNGLQNQKSLNISNKNQFTNNVLPSEKLSPPKQSLQEKEVENGENFEEEEEEEKWRQNNDLIDIITNNNESSQNLLIESQNQEISLIQQALKEESMAKQEYNSSAKQKKNYTHAQQNQSLNEDINIEVSQMYGQMSIFDQLTDYNEEENNEQSAKEVSNHGEDSEEEFPGEADDDAINLHEYRLQNLNKDLESSDDQDGNNPNNNDNNNDEDNESGNNHHDVHNIEVKTEEYAITTTQPIDIAKIQSDISSPPHIEILSSNESEQVTPFVMSSTSTYSRQDVQLLQQQEVMLHKMSAQVTKLVDQVHHLEANNKTKDQIIELQNIQLNFSKKEKEQLGVQLHSKTMNEQQLIEVLKLSQLQNQKYAQKIKQVQLQQRDDTEKISYLQQVNQVFKNNLLEVNKQNEAQASIIGSGHKVSVKTLDGQNCQSVIYKPYQTKQNYCSNYVPVIASSEKNRNKVITNQDSAKSLLTSIKKTKRQPVLANEIGVIDPSYRSPSQMKHTNSIKKRLTIGDPSLRNKQKN